MTGSPADRGRAPSIPGRRRSSPSAALLRLCACALIAVLGAADARAQSPETLPDQTPAGQAPRPSLVEPGTAQKTQAEPASVKAQATVFIAGASALATVGAFQSKLAPSSCRWCDLNPDGTDALNGLDEAARSAWLWQHPNTASTISDIVAYGIVPAVAFGADAWAAHAAGLGANFKVDALVIGESVLAAAGAAEILKFATARQRPYAHARALGQPTEVASQSSDNMSFTSGHAAVAFAMTVSAARVMTVRGYGHAGWVWGVGLPTAAAVSYFRVAADRHYLTDVLASAGIGTAVGLLVPRLAFTRRPSGSGAGARVAVEPLISRSFVGVSCAW